MSDGYDAVVVGAGVLGLAHAYHLARRGLRVAVVERHPAARGASVRNFGMLWPVGQPAGERYELARRSLDVWRDVLRDAGLWHDPCGSLHVARHADEEQVLREFAALGDRPCELLSAAEVVRRFPAVRADGLRAGLFSPTETCVDPRQVIAELPAYLTRRHGVAFHFGTTVLGYDAGRVTTTGETISAKRLVICTGEDFRDLAPQAFAASGLVRCKLQMMRSAPLPERLGTMLAGGLTLRHYGGFAACPTLPALASRFDAELPEYGRHGIHVMASQNEAGEVVIGDSHHYGDVVSPFDDPRVDDLILDYLRGFLNLPGLTISARWHGVYAKHPTAAWVAARPAPGVLAVTGVGGAGMTLSFGLAERTVTELLGA
ncbi:MAG: TIGR03364 family FAD-dependent oxidoreductase [Gemmataceae bacterium]